MTKDKQNSTKSKYIPAEIPRDSHKLIQKLAIDLNIPSKELYAMIIPLGYHSYQLLKLSVLSASNKKLDVNILGSVLNDCYDIYRGCGGTIQEILEHLYNIAETDAEQEIIIQLQDFLRTI